MPINNQGEALDDGTNVGTNVGENERKILSIIAHTPQATAREMAGILGITLRQCERILASLKQKGLIARVGANKGEALENQIIKREFHSPSFTIVIRA